MTRDKLQIDKFKEAAKELNCDEDEASWDESLKKVVKHEPRPEGPDQPKTE